MNPITTLKRKRLAQIEAIEAFLQEHGIVSNLVDVGAEWFSFAIRSPRQLDDSVMKALYLREGIERVVLNKTSRRLLLQICFLMDEEDI